VYFGQNSLAAKCTPLRKLDKPLSLFFENLCSQSLSALFQKNFSNRQTLPFFARNFKIVWSKGQKIASGKWGVRIKKTGTPHWPKSNIQIAFFN